LTPPTLDTERLRLRPTRRDDDEALHALFSDPLAMQWWTHGALETVEQTRAQIERTLTRPDWYGWVITLAGDDRAIGTLGANEKRQGAVFEIGYSLLRSEWGRGLASEAVGRLITWLIDDRRARRIFADTDPDNAPSNALLRRLGFTLEGRLRGEWETHIGVRDSLIWGLLASEWRSRV